ncbi:MAG: M13 family peptidase, partial [Bryobacteraceae bacterium]
MVRLNTFLLAAACSFAFAGAAWAQSQAKPQSGSGLDLKAIDRSVNPCDNFYRYACGNWLKSHPIPADESGWGRFNELQQRNQQVLRSILENAEQHEKQSAIDQRIGGFYHSCMDETAIGQRGTAPLRSELERIRAIRNRRMLLDEIARLQKLGIDVFFDFGPQPAPKNASMMIAAVDQGGLGLPDRDYYFRADAKSKEIRQKYVAHIRKMFELVGVPSETAAQKAQTVMGIETALAKASLNATERRNPHMVTHVMP